MLKLCVPECLLRLSDTRGEIRAAYSALLEVIPTHILTRYTLTHTHTLTHTYSHTYTHTHPHILTHTHIYSHTLTHTHTHILTHTLSHTHSHIHTHTHTLTHTHSFSQGVDSFQPPNGRKGLEGLRSCKGTWHARRVHVTKQSQVTFHGHHFKAIMGFIMHGFAPR